MKDISVSYFAVLREQRGVSGEVLSTRADSPIALYDELRQTHSFSLDSGLIRFAVNDRFVPPSHPLQDGDSVVFVPPVAGG